MKAALERFDAFYKAKTNDPAAPASSSSSIPASSKLKSPYLTRKLSISEDKPKVVNDTGSESPSNGENNTAPAGPSISSFIRRRQARVEPSSLSTNPSPSYDRSLSETRAGNTAESSHAEPAVSSLAKRYLGNLNTTKPENYSSIHNEAPALMTASMRASPPPLIGTTSKPNSPPPPPPFISSTSTLPRQKTVYAKEQNSPSPPPVTSSTSSFQKQRSTSMGAPLFTQKLTESNASSNKEKPASPPPQTVSQHQKSNNSNQTASSSSTISQQPRQHVNLIKLEVINSAKNRPGERRSSNVVMEKLNPMMNAASGVNKPPLPPSSSNQAHQSSNNNNSAAPAAPNIIPFGLAPNAWRSKLKSVQQPQQNTSINTSSGSNNEDTSLDLDNSIPQQQQLASTKIFANSSSSSGSNSSKVQSRIIPIEIKNSSKISGGKASTGNGGSLVQRSLSSVGTGSSSHSAIRSDRFSPPAQHSASYSQNRVRILNAKL